MHSASEGHFSIHEDRKSKFPSNIIYSVCLDVSEISHSCSVFSVLLSLCFNWAPRRGGVLGEWGYSSTRSLTSALDGGEWSASRPGRFTPRERAPSTHWIGGWVDSRAVLDAVVKRKIPTLRRDSNNRTPIVQPVAQRYTMFTLNLSVFETYLYHFWNRKRKSQFLCFLNTSDVFSTTRTRSKVARSNAIKFASTILFLRPLNVKTSISWNVPRATSLVTVSFSRMTLLYVDYIIVDYFICLDQSIFK
jgi:hypothetical protein